MREVGKELVDHPDWRWLAGMLAVPEAGRDGLSYRVDVSSSRKIPGYVPALDDWQTLGLLLGEVWEAAGPLTIGLVGGSYSGVSIVSTAVDRLPSAHDPDFGKALGKFWLVLHDKW